MARKRVRFPVGLLPFLVDERTKKAPRSGGGGRARGKYPADLISMGEIYISVWIFWGKMISDNDLTL